MFEIIESLIYETIDLMSFYIPMLMCAGFLHKVFFK